MTDRPQFVGGVVLFGVIAHFFPDHDDDPSDHHGHGHGNGHEHKQDEASDAAADSSSPSVRHRRRASTGGSNRSNERSAVRSTTKRTGADRARRAALMSGLITAVGMTLHNLPEGMAVCLRCVPG